MAVVVSQSPGILAQDLFREKMIDREAMNMAMNDSFTPYEKASGLLSAVEVKINAHNGDKNLKKLCQVLSKYEIMEKLAAHMMEKYSKLVVMLAVCTCICTCM